MKLGMVNTLEYCICCNMTKQCLKEGIPQHKALHPTGRYTSITVQHSKKPKQKIINDYEIRNGKYFGILHLL